MVTYRVNCSKEQMKIRKRRGLSLRGQMKIQEMAFVLVAIVIFFAMVVLFWLSIRVAQIDKGADLLGDEEAKELIKKMASSAEFYWGVGGCSNCIDLDKVMVLKDREGYQGFWNLDYLTIEKVYPLKENECDSFSYPECNSITIINKSEYFETPSSVFVSLCRWEQNQGGYFRCDLGKIYASGEDLE